MGSFENFLNKGSNYKQGSTPEYYENTHDRNGNYTGFSPELALPTYTLPIDRNTYGKGYATPAQTPYPSPQYATPTAQYTPPAQYTAPAQYSAPQAINSQLLQPGVAPSITQTPQAPYGSSPYIAQPIAQPIGVPLPSSASSVAPRNYQNLAVYQPTTPEDVEMLIDYLRRKEPAVINLDNVDEYRAQRVLDFVSGAIFALNGSIQRVGNNIFLLCPEGVQIIAPI